jgi:hypothetical protein
MKTEYPPLLDAGFREIGLWQLDEWFLEPFSEKNRRRQLIDRLRAYLEALQTLEVVEGVWIDGSFATFKPDPEDVDVLLLVNEAAVRNLTGSEALAFKSLVVDRVLVRNRFECDVYFTGTTNLADLQAWRERFGNFFWSTASKGIFTLTLRTNAPYHPD